MRSRLQDLPKVKSLLNSGMVMLLRAEALQYELFCGTVHKSGKITKECLDIYVNVCKI